MKDSEAIYKRHSIRKYRDDNLKDKIESIKDIIENYESLYSTIDTKIHLVEGGGEVSEVFKGIVGNYGKIKAPYYLLATSEEKDGYLENIGFILENIIIELTKLGLGTCWIGSAIKGEDIYNKLQVKEGHIPMIVVSLGYPDEEIKTHKRLDKEEIFKGDFDESWEQILDLVRVSPSAVNSQPWRFYKKEDVIDMYIEGKPFSFKGLFLKKMNIIDAGIALSHFKKALDMKHIYYEITRGPYLDIKNHTYITSIVLDRA
ncbi:nitroreductase family protein [Clostridium sp. D2Q-11]|uniref:Nitroreductase family protein n=1 Tax=Anaeromonas frigoriresistens TaxID=2683708 RepID=A0A942Z9A5_9FIRM|nr:nitroreductase family protein [Anaeromonas frigoriresistens]MBS4539123.1 nitroreductase family protein [Anaeromonas frigoriresistens]